MKTTPWFDADKKTPVRVGAYEVDDQQFKYWDGSRWGYYSQSPKQAKKYSADKWSSQSGFYWRGLLKESK
jgi:hypothetical protein